jgi:hypothetical protein
MILRCAFELAPDWHNLIRTVVGERIARFRLHDAFQNSLPRCSLFREPVLANILRYLVRVRVGGQRDLNL